MLIYSLIAIGVLLILAAILFLSDSLIQIEAQKSGVDTQKENFSIFPSFSDLASGPAPDGVERSHFHQLKKGHDIKLVGSAEKTISEAHVSRYSVRPQNFRGNAPIPKLVVAEGDEVKAGDVLFFDKVNEDIKYVAPVSGEIVEVRRGEKRSIIDVIILADKEQKYRNIEPINLKDCSRDELVAFLKANGAWPFFNQRPYDLVAESDVTPRDIFISCFDTAPLAPDNSFICAGQGGAFQKGINVLNKLTDGKVFLSLEKNEDNPVFTKVGGVERHYFSGPHPAGNVGVQIHHIKPIRGRDIVWTLGVQDVITIGKLLTEGRFDATRVVAVTGSEVSEPKYLKTKMGASIEELLKSNYNSDNTRIVTGDVLSGKTSAADSFLNFTDDQITVLKEGNQHEMFGWLLPLAPRPSVSKTYPNFLMPNHQFEANTNTHGEQRAFVVTGGYEKLLPMDIYIQHLMKAILTGNIERMEGLGINELSEEDIALAEFSDISKQPLQEILRDGLDMMLEQG